jgi:hypothetical protein
VLYFWKILWNKALTLASNAETNMNLTALETCYIAFRRDTVADLLIEEDRFDCEREFTVKVAQTVFKFLNGNLLPRKNLCVKQKRSDGKTDFGLVVVSCNIQFEIQREVDTVMCRNPHPLKNSLKSREPEFDR